MQTDEICKKSNRNKEETNDKKRKVKNSRRKKSSNNRERKVQNLGFDEERKKSVMNERDEVREEDR